MKKCPYCAEEIKDEAKICRFCGKELDKKTESPKDKSSEIFGILALATSGLSLFILPIVFAPLGFIFASVALSKGRKGAGLLAMVISIISLVVVISNIQSCARSLSSTGGEFKTSQKISAERQLELLSSRGYKSSTSHMTVEGQVKNITNRSLKSIQVVVQWYDKDGNFITSDEALIGYNPILPGQISPFDLISTYNPQMEEYSVSFKEFWGTLINTKDSRK